jgi:hypothetical protein
MPLLRYFVFVGGALLALLFIVNAALPALPEAESSRSVAALSVIRIRSETKWPERVVFDTSRPTTIAAPMTTAQAAPVQQTTAQNQVPQERVRAAFAQVTPNPGKLEPKPKRKTVARNSGSPRLLVAQQPSGVFFGNGW